MQINLTNFDAFKLTKRRGNSALIHILPPTSHQGILVFLLLSSFYFTTCQEDNVNLFPFVLSSFEKRYGHFDHEDLELARDQAREMFFFGYRNYLEHAFPMDELDPIQCRGRGPDYQNPDNLNINDVLGDFSLTLIDSLSSLIVLGEKEEFYHAVDLVVENVSFNKNVTVQVFEATIRIIGSLLSAHLVLTNQNPFLGNFTKPDYKDELLTMAHDVASRLLPAFNATDTGLPMPRVNLLHGVLPGTSTETCTAGAGSLLLEFGILSRLLNDPIFENCARRANQKLWQLRHKETGLLGNSIDVNTSEWKSFMTGLGAGFDSFFEYLLKAYILFGDERELEMFEELRQSLQLYLRRGRPKCRFGTGDAPMYLNVDMRDGSVVNTWVDSLQASLAGVQILAGEMDEAICSHAFYWALWQKYEMLPERFNWKLKAPDVYFYPLRPEFIESTYLLYLATKSPFYLHIGREIIDSLNLHTRSRCGFATVHSVFDKSLEDRMESFFLAETCKYLYLLFDVDNPVNKHYERLLFSTEGHLFPLTSLFNSNSNHTTMRWKTSDIDSLDNQLFTVNLGGVIQQAPQSASNGSCFESFNHWKAKIPFSEEILLQYYDMVNLDESKYDF